MGSNAPINTHVCAKLLALYNIHANLDYKHRFESDKKGIKCNASSDLVCHHFRFDSQVEL